MSERNLGAIVPKVTRARPLIFTGLAYFRMEGSIPRSTRYPIGFSRIDFVIGKKFNRGKTFATFVGIIVNSEISVMFKNQENL